MAQMMASLSAGESCRIFSTGGIEKVVVVVGRRGAEG